MGDIVTGKLDDGSSPAISLLQPFIFFGRIYNQTYVNNNGDLTFDQPWYSFTPYQFPAHGGRDIIAPFWTDIDNRANGIISYQQYTSGSVLTQATQHINQYFPQLRIRATWVFIATWDRVAYYPNSGTVRFSSKHCNYICMNTNCPAGYDTGNSSYYFSIPGSFQHNYTNLTYSSNVNVTGRWAFRVDQGSQTWPFYPFGVGDIMSDGRSPAVSLVQPFLFFGKTYSQTYINENGYLTFDNVWDSCVSYPFPRHGVPDIIAPFWTCIFRGRGVISYRQYTSGSVLTQATQDIYQYFAQLRFRATWVFVTTWARVAYYPNSGTEPSFQVVLISDGHLSFILMNYGQIAPTSMLVQVSTIWE
uniref:NIDO domain-containing protein n=1 Tax=Electrophorus electricus TaxID=8005 RepID=A0A4W4FVU4_ELEEL